MICNKIYFKGYDKTEGQEFCLDRKIMFKFYF